MRIKELLVNESAKLDEGHLSPLQRQVLKLASTGKYDEVDFEDLNPMTQKALSSLMDLGMIDSFGELTRSGRYMLSTNDNQRDKEQARFRDQNRRTVSDIERSDLE